MDMQRGLPLNRTRAAAWRPQIRPATDSGRHRCLMSVSSRLTRVPQQRLSILTACKERRGRAPDAGPRERQTRLQSRSFVQAALPHMRLHDLRHAAATLLLSGASTRER
jgi:integrase